MPIHLATKVAQDRLLRDTSLAERTSLLVDEVINLLSFCLDATYLAYNGDVFQQIFGMAMGSPVSVTVANLVMEDVEERALSTCPHPPPPFWKRYVDDTFTALPEDQVDRFLDHLNTVEPSIKFTMEKESNGSLSFLDTLVTLQMMGPCPHQCTERNPHRLLLGLYLPPPPCTQGCCGKDLDDPGRQDLHIRARQR